jgi:hypothetical protein
MRKNSDNDMPIGKLKRVADFLPPPEELVLPDETVKVTILLKKSSVKFFKDIAVKHNTKYQRMVRELIDQYALRYTPREGHF